MNTTKQIMKRPRTLTRIAAVQALFQWEQGTEKASNLIIEEFLLHRVDTECTYETYASGKTCIPDVPFFKMIIERTIHQNVKIDTLLARSLPKDWPMHRLDPLIRSILRAATTELLSSPNTPPTNVIINEYLDVTHAFCDGDEATLINGILDYLGRFIRGTDIPTSSDNV